MNNESLKSNVWVAQLIFIQRSIRHSIRNTDAMIMAIALPILLMLLFTYVFGGAIDPSGNYVTYVVPGTILLCAGFGSSSVAVDVAQDMTNGIIDRFRTMSVRSLDVINGHVVASVLRNLLATTLVIGVALLIGFRTEASFLQWLGAIGIITLFIFTFTWLFAAIGMMASGPSAAGGYGFVLLFLPYLSSAFVPTNTMPGWLRGIADHQPITPITETIRSLLNDSPLHTNGWWSLGWCSGLLLVAFVLSAWSFQRKSGRR